jgi:RND family efflux transporter MFP subunit
MRWIAVTLTAAMMVFAGCADKEAQREAKIQRELLSDKTVPVTFATPKVADIQSTLEISGPLKALDEVQLGAKVTGRLTMVSVRDGSPVRRGQVIARVETEDIQQQLLQAHAAVEAAQSARDQAVIQARISPQQTDAAIRQAQSALNSAKARLELTRKGARSQDRAQAQQRVNSAKSRVDKTKADLDRAKKLYEGDAISKSEVDAAQWQYDSALADYRSALEAMDAIVEGARPEELRQAQEAVLQAEEQLRIAKTNSVTDSIRRQQVQQAEAALRQARANVALAQYKLADASIVSPVDGYVSGKTAQVGQVVSPGTPVATVVGLNGIYFEGQIPEVEIPNVSVGMRATVTMDAMPNRVFDGSLIAINPKADALGRLFSARISINDVAKALRPGMFGKGKLITATILKATLVPMDAVLRQDGKAYVYVAEGQIAKRRTVELGRQQGEWIQVKGVAASDKVILKGKDVVTDGATIREDKPAAGAAR